MHIRVTSDVSETKGEKYCLSWLLLSKGKKEMYCLWKKSNNRHKY